MHKSYIVHNVKAIGKEKKKENSQNHGWENEKWKWGGNDELSCLKVSLLNMINVASQNIRHSRSMSHARGMTNRDAIDLYLFPKKEKEKYR